MKRIRRVCVILSMICLIGCTDKEVHNFRFDDWSNYYRGITSNPLYNEVFTVTKDLAEVKVHVTKVIDGEKKAKLISVKKFKDGLLQEHYESPFRADDSTIRYYYDEYKRLVKEDYYDDKNVIIPSLSFEYTYEYDAETKKFIQKVYSEGVLQNIFRETPIKNGYRLEKESIERKRIEDVYEVDISKHKVVQYREMSEGIHRVGYYDFTYNDIRLNTILYRSITKGKEVYINGYEVVSYNDDGNIAEMTVYNYDRKDKTKRELTARLFFSDYDKAGNWQRKERIYEENNREPETTIREFIYTE